MASMERCLFASHCQDHDPCCYCGHDRRTVTNDDSDLPTDDATQRQ